MAGSPPPAPNTKPMPSFARRRLRVLLGVVALVAVLVPTAMWLRDSSLVQVRKVTVNGIAGRQAPAVRAALTEAALDMSVLDVRRDALKTAVEPYPVVRSLRTQTDFPHAITITVNAYEPVAALKSGAGLTPVAADGTILRGNSAHGLALVGVAAPPHGDRVGDATTLREIGLLAAAPPALRARVARVYRGPKGLAATLESGPKLYFGGTTRYEAKWSAAAVVLAHRTSRGASYLDLRVPERPVAGGLQPRAQQSEPQL
ncbi:MAG: cell division protein FtsQ [Solirubrobacteraceae bacterium]|nr:cell division protein FtsQ [Solirubrobacteraceae bacterium]